MQDCIFYFLIFMIESNANLLHQERKPIETEEEGRGREG
jgi:hypothetical protein